MKKYITGIIMLASSAFAEEGAYLKGGVGLNTINPLKIKDEELKGKTRLTQTFPLIEAAAGYRINDRVRTEVAFDYYFLFKNRESSYSIDTNYDLLSRTKINALFLNTYLDVLKFNKVSLFLGGGVGVSFQKEKVGGYAVSGTTHYPLTEAVSKQTNRFAYKLTAGLDFKLSNSVNAEASYNYFDLGYNKPKIIDGVSNIRRRNYLVHNITIGLRYAL